MNKYPKHVNGVFTEVVGSDKELSKFELFLNCPILRVPIETSYPNGKATSNPLHY